MSSITKIDLTVKGIRFSAYGDTRSNGFGFGRDFVKNNGIHEPIVSEYLVDYFSKYPESVFYDIGASFGYYTFLVNRASNNKAMIYSFESKPERLDVILKTSEELLSDSSNIILVPGSFGEEGFRGKVPDVVKIDVDGAEVSVLIGLLPIIEACSVILLEVHYAYEYKRTLDFLRENFRGSYDVAVSYDHRSLNELWVKTSFEDDFVHKEQGDFMLLLTKIK